MSDSRPPLGDPLLESPLEFRVFRELVRGLRGRLDRCRHGLCARFTTGVSPVSQRWAESSAMDAVSQILAVWSVLPVTRRRPSGENATQRIPLACPRSVNTSWPVSVSQSLTVWSLLAEATRRPSGLNVTPQTSDVWPWRTWVLRPVFRSKTLTSPGGPDLVGEVAASGEPESIGAERQHAR